MKPGKMNCKLAGKPAKTAGTKSRSGEGNVPEPTETAKTATAEAQGERKREFIEKLKASFGILTAACEAAKISRQTYYNWRREDEDFAREVDEVQEIQGDFVESKLLQLIDAGDTTAIIFYCKTKLKKRGYTEKPPVKEEQPKPVETVPLVETEEVSASNNRRINNKKRYIINLLKQQGIYSPELSYQVSIAATLLVKTDELAGAVLAAGHKPVSVEISREGNERQSISATERLYMEYAQKAQKALRALGMNTDAKNKVIDNNELGDFMQQISDND